MALQLALPLSIALAASAQAWDPKFDDDLPPIIITDDVSPPEPRCDLFDLEESVLETSTSLALVKCYIDRAPAYLDEYNREALQTILATLPAADGARMFFSLGLGPTALGFTPAMVGEENSEFLSRYFLDLEVACFDRHAAYVRKNPDCWVNAGIASPQDVGYAIRDGNVICAFMVRDFRWAAPDRLPQEETLRVMELLKR